MDLGQPRATPAARRGEVRGPDRADYEYAKQVIVERRLLGRVFAILLSPVHGVLDPGIWPSGSWPTACRCACSSRCTSTSGAPPPGAYDDGEGGPAEGGRSAQRWTGLRDGCRHRPATRASTCTPSRCAYGQRHVREVEAARVVARAIGVGASRRAGRGPGGVWRFGADGPHRRSEGPDDRPRRQSPSTYVPARNTIFLALALGWAEVIGARDIFIGVNALDYSGYPDCRPEFIEAFERLAAAGHQGRRRRAVVPHPRAAARA